MPQLRVYHVIYFIDIHDFIYKDAGVQVDTLEKCNASFNCMLKWMDFDDMISY